MSTLNLQKSYSKKLLQSKLASCCLDQQVCFSGDIDVNVSTAECMSGLIILTGSAQPVQSALRLIHGAELCFLLVQGLHAEPTAQQAKPAPKK